MIEYIHTAGFSNLFTGLPHSHIIDSLFYLTDLCFTNAGKEYIFCMFSGTVECVFRVIVVYPQCSASPPRVFSIQNRCIQCAPRFISSGPLQQCLAAFQLSTPCPQQLSLQVLDLIPLPHRITCKLVSVLIKPRAVAQVVFERGQGPRRALNVEQTITGKHHECTAAVCRNGVTLGSVVDAFLPDAVAKIPFRKVEELAKAINLWDSDEKVEIKKTLSRKDPYNIPVVAEKKGWRKATAALTKSCPHRHQTMKETFGIPMYSGYQGIFAQRDPFVEATEKVRAEVNRTRGATKARVVIFGEARACKLSKVLVGSEHVAVKTAGKQLQFSNWSELSRSPWEMGPFTGIGIFLLDVDAKEQDAEEIVAALQKCPDVQTVIMAPPFVKGHKQTLQKMKEWFMAMKGKNADRSWIFAGWQDGPGEIDLIRIDLAAQDAKEAEPERTPRVRTMQRKRGRYAVAKTTQQRTHPHRAENRRARSPSFNRKRHVERAKDGAQEKQGTIQNRAVV
ncbi:unnamed protein product [Gongylonema pulchrum]|uniref:PARP n=1 Tax=Gongylonema pulchrum TaxID=637853 RepID=A0A183E311_9BILA|nr:unnamed protein product [Gongylonema pulchrum]